jgi:ATP phosphoribosyltransferase
LNQRLRRFSVFPVWGGAEAYPPESATLALVAGSTDEKLLNNGLMPLQKVLNFCAYLIANRGSWGQKDLGWILATLENVCLDRKESLRASNNHAATKAIRFFPKNEEAGEIVRIALPDGHQQKPAIELLNRAGIRVDDYPSQTGNRRPGINLEGVAVKVIRPQDMPLQVANGNFDLAITGIDWLTDHFIMFPSSPVQELCDLKFGWVKLVAVVSRDVPFDNILGIRQISASKETPFRVASEYVNIADKYARDNHLGMYRVIPTWGATEAFLPEDADLLIENTETGGTIARHNLKIIDTLSESTARLIGNKNGGYRPVKQAMIDSIIKKLSEAVGKK